MDYTTPLAELTVIGQQTFCVILIENNGTMKKRQHFSLFLNSTIPKVCFVMTVLLKMRMHFLCKHQLSNPSGIYIAFSFNIEPLNKPVSSLNQPL